MKTTFFRGVVLGAVVSAVTVVASAAVAGTGVGGVFNLGKTNTVNASTTLTGATNGNQLQVANSSTGSNATGVGINVAKGKAPLTVNSSKVVKHLNADQLDGLTAAQFQRRATNGCTNGTAIETINADGTVVCTADAVFAISTNVAAPGFRFHPIGTTSLEVDFACHDPATTVTFFNTGTIAAEVNWMFSQGGTTSTVDAGGAADGGRSLDFTLSGSRLEGQFIWDNGSDVVTVNLHVLDIGSACEIIGTAEVAPVIP